MVIKTAEFVVSNTQPKLCPAADKPEFAFIGRSNVGKSSLLNMLAGIKKLAKVSTQPGKTRTINHFLVNDAWFMVDLPGYGYAKASRGDRYAWSRMMETYFLNRTNLTCTFILIDIRLKPQPNDMDFIQWMGSKELPIAIVMTKADKLTLNKSNQSKKLFSDTLLKTWDELPPIFVTSAEKKTGRDELLNFIEEALDREKQFN
jgi:GTP-binding protein